MQSKYKWLISLAHDKFDLDEIWSFAASDTELDDFDLSNIADMLEERLDQLKGR